MVAARGAASTDSGLRPASDKVVCCAFGRAYGLMALVDEQKELEKALARVAVLEAELATLQGKPKKTDDLSNLEVLCVFCGVSVMRS